MVCMSLYIKWLQVDAINPKRMLAFLNHFIVHTTGFLNRFSVICEEKLEDLSVRLQRLETTVCLLEAKVSGVLVAAAVTSYPSIRMGHFIFP